MLQPPRANLSGCMHYICEQLPSVGCTADTIILCDMRLFKFLVVAATAVNALISDVPSLNGKSYASQDYLRKNTDGDFKALFRWCLQPKVRKGEPVNSSIQVFGIAMPISKQCERMLWAELSPGHRLIRDSQTIHTLKQPTKSKALVLLSVVELSATTPASPMMHAPRIKMPSCVRTPVTRQNMLNNSDKSTHRVYHKGSSSLETVDYNSRCLGD